MNRASRLWRRVRIAGAALVLFASSAAAAGWFAWGRGDGAVAQPMPDFAALTRAATPNQYLLLPSGFQAVATPDAVSPRFDVSVDRLETEALRVIRMQPRTVEIARDPEQRQYAFVQRTPILRFPDTITVRFVDLPDGRSSLAIYSRSRIGRSDLGVNRRRVDGWLAAIGAAISE